MSCADGGSLEGDEGGSCVFFLLLDQRGRVFSRIVNYGEGRLPG
jgi:hypothetical protein